MYHTEIQNVDEVREPITTVVGNRRLWEQQKGETFELGMAQACFQVIAKI